MKRITAVFIAGAMLTLSLPLLSPEEVYAAGRTMKLSTARSLALENSTKYIAADDEIFSKQAAYESAVKSLKLKKKNLSTFRWKPLLNLKFPQTPDFSQASEFEVKPLAAKNEISVAQHKKQDEVFAINEEINNLYVDIVTLQDNIRFNEERVEDYQETIARLNAQLKLGQATKSDIDRIKKKLDTLNSTLANDRRNYEASVQKLSKKIGLDVTTGYEFESPYVEAVITRENLPGLIRYTEDRDETYYEACMEATTQKMEVTTNAGLLRSKYGGDYRMISGYVNSALNGHDVNSRAFKNDYKKFLEKIDSKWNGKFRILFIKLSRLWRKGDLDGTRYIEDDPYVLYNNVLDYVGARRDEEAAKEELDQEVTDQFNNYISVRSSYENYKKEVDEEKKKLDEYIVQNKMGYMTMEEYQDAVDAYEELQNSMLDAMKLYTTTLYSFDRLTCGGISALLSGTDADMQTAVLGESSVKKSEMNTAMYFINPIIQKEMFELWIYIPKDFPTEITDYELWCDNMLIGDRTAKDAKIRHLVLAKDDIKEAKIRLYNGEELVDDCVIDPDLEKGPLNITVALEIDKQESGVVGSYTSKVNDVTGFMTLSFKFLESEGITAYRVLAEDGTPLLGQDRIDVKKEFSYLGLVGTGLEKIQIECYDSSGSLKYTCRLVTSSMSIKKKDIE